VLIARRNRRRRPVADLRHTSYRYVVGVKGDV
jgi:hypothetical protein